MNASPARGETGQDVGAADVADEMQVERARLRHAGGEGVPARRIQQHEESVGRERQAEPDCDGDAHGRLLSLFTRRDSGAACDMSSGYF
jgi:hypothetical protein